MKKAAESQAARVRNARLASEALLDADIRLREEALSKIAAKRDERITKLFAKSR